MTYKKALILFSLLVSISVCSFSQATEEVDNPKEYLKWENLPALPDALGLAGHFVGVHNDAIIVAGGANFPKPVWENEKKWRDKIWVMHREISVNGDITYEWIDAGELDYPVAYGASVSTDKGVICIGGCNSQKVSDKVFLLRWDPDASSIKQEYLPSLPESCAYTSAAKIGSKIYVAGGQSGKNLDTAMKNFWYIDLERYGSEEFEWKKLPSWPGSSRAFNITAAQHNGFANCVYVISGRRIEKGEGISETEFLTDVYEFNPKKVFSNLKGKESPWRKRSDVPSCVMAGTGIDIGQSHIFIFGGADGSLFTKGSELKLEHPGFPRKSWAYHTITDTWIKTGETPANLVTTKAVKWDDSVIIPSGEIKPRVRTPEIWKIKPIEVKKSFGIINSVTLAVYLVSMIGVGYFFSFRNKNTNDYFRGGQKIASLVAALSIFATMLSSITFIAIPAKAYATNWVFVFLNVPIIIVAPFIIKKVLPFFRKIDAVSAYEYLEKRFNILARLFASLSFTLFQIGRMAVVLYLPALALSAITPMNGVQCVLIMGIISTIYCTMGGIEAVVWTDAIQTVILLGAAILSFVLIVCSVDGGISRYFAVGAEESKFHMINWDWSTFSYTTTAFWVLVLGGIGQALVPYSSDQAVVQRYMVTSSEKKAGKSIWTNAVISLLASILFFGLGTALFVFYKANPSELDPTFKTDAIFPQFIAHQLPVGIAGIVIAGIFAAAQSTLSTSLNSVSSTITTDFIRRFDLAKSERAYFNIARILTFMLGLLGTTFALVLVVSDIRSAWEVFIQVLGLFGGSMCGLFMLGIFTTRTTSLGALAGAFLGAGCLFMIQKYTETSGLLYAIIGIILCYVLGYIVSLMLPEDKKSIDGLTIYSVNLDFSEDRLQ